MLLQEKTGQVDKQGDIKTSEFKICTTRKAFEILSAGLYSDRVAAIVRELSTNAADSHKEAKQDRPFEIHLPSMMEPYFKIRDYGTGISEESVFSLYTSYFDSNRNRSNEYTGCLGLGSKSPFSYTDQFQVDSRYNGDKTTYTCYIGESGTPAVTKLASVKTDEPNGVDITISVKQTDFDAFYQKAMVILPWFKPRPVVSGGTRPGFSIVDPKYMHRTELYGVPEGPLGSSRVIMGNVCYALASEHLLTHGEPVQLARVLKYGVDLYLPIGTVEISASREQLGYTKATVAKLHDIFKDVLKDLEVFATSLISSATSIWEARKLLYKHQKSLIAPLLPPNPSWKGHSITADMYLTKFQGVPKSLEHCVYNGLSMKRTNTNFIIPDGRPIFVDDFGLGAYARVENYLATTHYTTGHSSAYIISNECTPIDTKIPLPDFQKASGVPEAAVRISTLPKPAPGTRAAGPGVTPYSTLLKFNVKVSGSRRDGWENIKKNPAEGGHYVRCLRFVARYNDGTRDLHPVYKQGVHELVEASKVLGLTITELFGIRPSDMDVIEKHKAKWTEFFDDLKKLLQKDPVLVRLASLANDSDNIRKYGAFLTTLSRLGLPGHHIFGELIVDMKDAMKGLDSDKVKAFNRIRSELKIEIDEKFTFGKRIDEALKKYPLLTGFHPHTLAERAGEVARYIKAIDLYTETKKSP